MLILMNNLQLVFTNQHNEFDLLMACNRPMASYGSTFLWKKKELKTLGILWNKPLIET